VVSDPVTLHDWYTNPATVIDSENRIGLPHIRAWIRSEGTHTRAPKGDECSESMVSRVEVFSSLAHLVQRMPRGASSCYAGAVPRTRTYYG